MATVTTSPTRPTAQPTARHPGPRPTPPSDPAPPTLRPVAVPAACELNAPADGLQRSADAGHLPWRLDPAEVVLQCLRRGLGAAAWRISRIGEHAVAVAEPRSRFIARVRLQQPARHGPGGIWGVTAIDANTELILPPACIEPDAAALQASFDQGHQPWHGDPLTKAELCVASAYGWRHPHGPLISANTSRSSTTPSARPPTSAASDGVQAATSGWSPPSSATSDRIDGLRRQNQRRLPKRFSGPSPTPAPRPPIGITCVTLESRGRADIVRVRRRPPP